MKTIHTIAIAWLFGITIVLGLHIRRLELLCRGQCHYGDAGCAERCLAAGHCEASND